MSTSDSSSPATLIVEHESPDPIPSQDSSEERRKSVENLLISSHEVIGSSISPSLAFSAMTIPQSGSGGGSHSAVNLQPHPSPVMHTLDPRSSSPSLSGSPQSSPCTHHKRESSRSGSVDPPTGRDSSLSRVESSSAFSQPVFDGPPQSSEHPSGRSSESSNPPASLDVWMAGSRTAQEGGSGASSVGGSSGVGGGSSSSSSVVGSGGNVWYLTSAEKKEKKESSVEREKGGGGGSKGSSGGEGGGGGSFDKAKKSSWYNALYPTYKTRSEDFKRIFKDLPAEERLIVDYSSALQKDILVHGRIYVSQNYLSFYANIFRWETSVSLRWKEVTSITKEKTALVIPNAIQVCTESGERHFFTSFGARDKTYLMLFRVWQNALMEERMSMQEMWQWVHTCYGDELGLTSDDEEGYVAPPTTDDDKMSAISVKFSVDSLSEDYMNVSDQPSGEEREFKGGSEERGMGEGEAEDAQQQQAVCGHANAAEGGEEGGGMFVDGFQDAGAEEKERSSSTPGIPIPPEATVLMESQFEMLPSSPPLSSSSLLQPPLQDHLPSDMSDTTESEAERNIREGQDELRPTHIPCCSSPHEGRQLVSVILPIHVDQLFMLLFTTSKFYLDFHAQRRTCDILQSPWQNDPKTKGQKVRQVSLTLSLSHSMGPKTAQVTENMVMLPCSRPGFLYSIDVEAHNSGIPYSDSFYCFTHFCLSQATMLESKVQGVGSDSQQTPQSQQGGSSTTTTTTNTSATGSTPSPPPASSTPIHGSPSHQEGLSPSHSPSSRSPRHHTPRHHVHNHHIASPHPSSCILSIFTQIKYKKSVWGLVKSIIEKNSWSGLEEFYQSLVAALQLECEKMLSRGGLAVVHSGSPGVGIAGAGKRKTRLRRRRHGMLVGQGGAGGVGAVIGAKEEEGAVVGGGAIPGVEGGTGGPCTTHLLHHATKRGSGDSGGGHAPEILSCVALLVLVFLLLLNALLYYKLWALEEWTHQSNTHAFSVIDLHILRHPPKSHDEWLRLLQHQEALHHVELEKWQRILQAAIQLLRQTEESLADLLRNIHPVINQRILAATELKPLHSPPKGGGGDEGKTTDKGGQEWELRKTNQQVPMSLKDESQREVFYSIPESEVSGGKNDEL
ncbi:protein Aster-B-like isoform X2 [Ischnura elegans]|uniref:protein Aster-B-like isoform X2 n=1 Tax=Ischnura elegans TaxID=197161 RepID=UPI001ED8A2A9|nr:protein Aster-B-like isoform X2 [Ischnura elegans]